MIKRRNVSGFILAGGNSFQQYHEALKYTILWK